jgi:dihydropteroate synthase
VSNQRAGGISSAAGRVTSTTRDPLDGSSRAAAGTEWTLELPAGRSLQLALHHPRVMGVLNVTPDSFSDGGRWLDPATAVEHALRMIAEGADLIDVGAESTRPGGGVYGAGAEWVPPEEEWKRLQPVIERLRGATDTPISVDTRKGAVARRALRAGADLVNDISALSDPEMARVVAETGCPVILMHARGKLTSMQKGIDFDDVVREVRDELADIVDHTLEAGIEREKILIDPGIGFGKTAEQNLELIRRLDALDALGRPIVVGASRKSFISSVSPAPVENRLGGSLAAATWATREGAAILRVHDVQPTVQFLRVLAAIEAATGARP